MTTWREVYTKLLIDVQDPGAVSFLPFPEALGVSWAELTINLVYMISKSVLSTVTGRADFALVNIQTKLPDLSLVHSVRKTSGDRVDPLGYNALTALDTVFSATGPVKNYYTIGATIFGVAPIGNDQLDLNYIPYSTVNTIDDQILIRNEFLPAIAELLHSLILARMGQFERATEKLKQGLAGVHDVQRRPFH